MKYFWIFRRTIGNIAIVYTFPINTALNLSKNFIQYQYIDIKESLKLIKVSKDNLIF